MVYSPSIQRPRSTSRQRSEQKGKCGRASRVGPSNARPQVGHLPRIMIIRLRQSEEELLDVDGFDSDFDADPPPDDEPEELSLSALAAFL